MGSDGLLSLLDMLNQIKEEILIPTKLNLSNISTIYKGKGSKQNVVNLRGIFKLPIIRNLLDRLIYFDEQEQISASMGQFQVGNQKGRNIRDHTLIVHAVVNEAQEQKKNIDIQFTDIKQCFDSIWLDEATNDLFNSGVISRNLNLLYQGNSITRMCVETNFGQSERVVLNKVVMQGSVPGGVICSNQVAKLCNKLYSEGEVYMFRDKIPIPALAMVDDIAVIAQCNSIEGINRNIKTDTFIQRKKMQSQVGEGKCQWVHIGTGECKSSYVMDKNNITEAEAYKHLGNYVADGWETLYTKRWEKAQGYSTTCQAMCTEMSLGNQMYSIAKLLHRSIFVNGTLVCMETWPNCTENRIETLERVEQTFFRKILKAHSKTPIEAIYLELGVIPLRFHLMKKRIMYYHDILNREEKEITKQVVLEQKKWCGKGDFYAQVMRDIDSISITNEEMDESKEKVDVVVERKVKIIAFEYLISKAKNHSKVNDKSYENCDGVKQYSDPRFTPDLINILFKFRTRTYLVKNNFRNNYKNTNILCPVCEKHDDTQEHIFRCRTVVEKYEGDISCTAEDTFSNDMDTLYNVAKTLKKLDEIRNELTSNEE